MSITLPVELEPTVRRMVASGRYSDTEAVLNETFRLLAESERQRDELLAKLQIGIDQADRGELHEWTPELRDRLIREADEMYLRGDEPDPDVLP